MLFLLSGFPDGCFLFCFSLFHFVSLLSKMQILLPGRHSSPDMTLLFVDVQHIPDRPCHGRVDLLKAIGTILMYRRLTDPKLLRRLPHRSFCFYDIARNFYCTLLNIILHDKIPCVHYFYNVCRGFGGYVCGTPQYNRYNTVSAFSFLNFLCQNIFLPIYLLLVHRFRNNCIIHLSTNPIAQFKKPQRSPLRLRFFNCTLESVSCVNDTVIYETMY